MKKSQLRVLLSMTQSHLDVVENCYKINTMSEEEIDRLGLERNRETLKGDIKSCIFFLKLISGYMNEAGPKNFSRFLPYMAKIENILHEYSFMIEF